MDERDHGFPTLNEKNPTIIIFQCVINGTLDSLELLFCKCQLTFLSNCQSFHLFWEMLHTLGGKGTNISFGPKCLNCCKGWLAYVICNASSLSFLPSNSGTKQDFVLRAGRGRWVWWGYVLTLPVLSGQNLGLLGTWILPFLHGNKQNSQSCDAVDACKKPTPSAFSNIQWQRANSSPWTRWWSLVDGMQRGTHLGPNSLILQS